MGDHNVEQEQDPQRLRQFMQQLLDDTRALEQLLAEGRCETGIRRIGAEQEMFLVDPGGLPAPLSTEVLNAVQDPGLTTELARFNLELNLEPLELHSRCFSQLEQDLARQLAGVRAGAEEVGARVLLVGILPTLDLADLSLDNMAPVPRYFTLNDAVRKLRGGNFRLHLKGRDELFVEHDNVMLEACNTSFQVHLQVEPATFAPFYNAAQVATGPVLAASTFSPLLFGKQLWAETRIALFQQSVDTRQDKSAHRQQRPRVSFGDRWIEESVLEIFREDIARFRLLLSVDEVEDPFQALREGRAPALNALRLHNGTVYRWNRACYGVGGGLPHLRIENRVLPSGPTMVDEVANTAFWIGLVHGLVKELGDVARHLDFDAVKTGFLASAREGLRAQLPWIDGRTWPAAELICKELLPRAREGLLHVDVDAKDADHYLGIVQQRVESGRTGASWLVNSLANMNGAAPRQRLGHLVVSLLERQESGQPVHEWEVARGRPRQARHEHFLTVRDLMSTDLFTVGEDEVIDLVASVMDWRHIRHVPVEDNQHRLVGLVTHRGLLRFLAQNYGQPRRPAAVREIMTPNPHTVSPETPTLDAILLMRQHQVSCLPVVEGTRLVGIVSERDFMKISAGLLDRFLQGSR